MSTVRGFRNSHNGGTQPRANVPTYDRHQDDNAGGQLITVDHRSLGGAEIKPNPDPSIVTVQSIDRAANSLQELFEVRFDGVDTRFEAINRATDKFEANLTRVPTETQKAVDGLKQVIDQTFQAVYQRFTTVDEKFNTVAREFKLRDDYTNQSAIDRKEELKTALSAAEKAVDKQATSFTSATDKSEKATLEQIRQQSELLRTTKEGLETQIGDLKVRLAIAEATASAAKESAATAAATAAAVVLGQRQENVAHQVDRGFNTGVMFNFVSVVIAVGAVIIAFLKP